MKPLEHVLEQTILICAERETVFEFFQDSSLFAEWWGPGSRIDPRPGGEVAIRYPNGDQVTGKVVSIDPPREIAFTYGYTDPSKPIAPGASEVRIALTVHTAGTLLKLRHAFADAATRDMHVAGWRYQLALYSGRASARQHASLDQVADQYFSAWSETEANARRQMLSSCVTDAVSFRDPYGCTDSLETLNDHIGASQMHLPGCALQRRGPTRQCQGTALADWTATGRDDAVIGKGTNVFVLAPDGRIARIVGFWG